MLQAILRYNREERARINADAGRDRGKDTIMQFDTLQKLNHCVDVQLSLKTYVTMRTRESNEFDSDAIYDVARRRPSTCRISRHLHRRFSQRESQE